VAALNTAPLQILALYVRHGSNRYGSALGDLERYYRTRLPNAKVEIVVIDNALPSGHRGRANGAHALIGGSNSAWEFSAWDEGLAVIGPRLLSFDFVHLVTSAFGQHFTGFIDRIDEPMLALARRRAFAIGHIDAYNAPVELFGRQSQAWLRSSFIFLPPVELRLLGPVA
jgi:hypothetical protein